MIPTFNLPADKAVQFRTGVARVQRDGGKVLLVPPGGGNPVRITAIGELLIPRLMEGTTFPDLVTLLKVKYPKARDVATKLSTYLAQLDQSGLLDTGREMKRKRPATRIKLLNIDPAARITARVLGILPRPAGLMLIALLVGASLTGLVLLIRGGTLPSAKDLYYGFDLFGLLFFIFVTVFLHEFGHAVACRLTGVAVTEAGIILHGFLIPGPYVDTSAALTIQDRWKRFWIPAAGPLVNLISAGAAGWTYYLLDGTGPIAGAAYYVLMLSLLFLYLDTNPWSPSDGSHMLEALFNDEYARKAALSKRHRLMVSWKTVSTYKVIGMLHLQSMIALVWLTW